MNTMTTRSIAVLAATGAIVVGGATAASATTTGDSAGVTPDTSTVEQLYNEAVEDGYVLLEEENKIKQAIADRTGLKFESLDDPATLG